MELSIVIVSYNVCSYLRDTLASVRAAAVDTDHEIIVCDNASADGSVEMVRKEFPQVTVIASVTNEGFSAGCNRGIEASAGDFILILNPDTLLDPDSLTRALAFMHSTPDAGAAGARMTDGRGRFLPESKRGFPTLTASLFKVTGLWKLFPRSSFFNAYYLGHLPEGSNCRADILTGAFMLTRRTALLKAGLFDTGFFMYGEDIDMSWRIVQAGFHNYYLADVHITHFKGKSAATEAVSSRNHFYDAMVTFARKHFKRVWMPPVILAVACLRVLSLLKLYLQKLIKN